MAIPVSVLLECLRPSSLTIQGQVEYGLVTPDSEIEHPSQPYIFVIINSGITVINISNRASPTVVGTVTDAVGLIGNFAIHSLAFDSTGRYLYTTSGATSLYTFDLGVGFADIQDPNLVSTVAISAGGSYHVVNRIGSNLYILSDSANQIQVVSISTPASPSVTSTDSATNIALGCVTGFPNVTNEYIAYPAQDNSGKIGAIAVASPTTQSVFQMPTVGGGQIRLTAGLFFVSEDLLYTVAYYVVGSKNHYFWVALDITSDLNASTPILTEKVVSGTISSISAPILAVSPVFISSTGTFQSQFKDLAISFGDSSAATLSEIRFYRVNADSALERGRVPKLVAAKTVPGGFSLRLGFGGTTTNWFAVGSAADRAIGYLALFTTDLLSLNDASSFFNLTSSVCANPGIEVSRGISGLGPTDRVPSTGTMSFDLDNSELSTLGGFSPDSGLAPADFLVGAQARLTVAGDVVFRGIIDSIDPIPGKKRERRVHVTCVDMFDILARLNTDTIAGRTNLALQEIIETLMDSVPPIHGCQSIANMDFRLQNYVLGAVTQEFEDYDFAFDRAYDEKTAIVGEIQKVMNSERGVCYLVPDGGVPGGFLRFQSIDDSLNQPILGPVFDDSVTVDMMVSHARESVYNHITVRAFPRRVDSAATTVLFTLQSPPLIRAGETVIIDAPFRDPSGLASRVGGAEMVAPVAATDYAFRTKKSGAGTNLNSQLSVSAVFGGASAKIVVTNNGPRPGYLTLMQLRGKGIYSQEPILVTVLDPESITANGSSELVYDMPYTTDANEARAMAEALLEVYANPRTFIRSITWIASGSQSRLDQFLDMRIGSKIAVQETVLGLTDTDYWTLGTSVLGTNSNLYGLGTYQVQRLSFNITGLAPNLTALVTATAELIPSELNFRPAGWNEPRNWTPEILTADLFNQQFRDNFDALDRIISRMTSDVVSSSTTFLDLSGLTFDLNAGETWVFWVTSFLVSNATANVKYTVTINDIVGTQNNSLAFGRFGLWANGIPVSVGNESNFGNPVNYTVTTTLEDAAILTGVISALTDCRVVIRGAQNAVSGTTTFRAESFIIALNLSKPHESGVYKSWNRNESVDASKMNTTRDSLRGLYMVTARQTSTLTKNANTTFSDLAGMSFTMKPGEVWVFVAVLFMSGSANADAKFTVTAPSGSTGRFGVAGSGVPITAGSTTVFGDPVAMTFAVSSQSPAILTGRVNGRVSAGGTVQLQAAQNTSDATDTNFYADSFLVAWQIGVPLTADGVQLLSVSDVASVVIS